MKKLAIQEEREEDNYTFETALRSWPDDARLIPEASEHPKVGPFFRMKSHIHSHRHR